MNINIIKDVLDNAALLPLVLKIDFFGVKIPILCPITVKRNIEINAETLEKIKVIDKDYKYKGNKKAWIFSKLLSLGIFIFFVCFFYFFKESLSEFDPLYIRVLYTLAIFWVCFFWMMYPCDVKITSQGIYYRRFSKQYFVPWLDIEGVTQTRILVSPYWYVSCIIVTLKTKSFSSKCIAFYDDLNLYAFKYFWRIKVEEITKYIKYKIENLEGS